MINYLLSTLYKKLEKEKKVIKYIIFLSFTVSIIFTLTSCEKKKVYPYPCIHEECSAKFWIDDYSNPGAYYNVEDGYWRVKYHGLGYFTIRGKLSELHDYYVINEVPLIETVYDSDYWIVFDTIAFTIPIYSYLGWFTDEGLEHPIPIGDTTYTIVQLTENASIFNVAGYTISKYTNYDRPYSSSLFGTYSKYDYEPSQNIFVNNEMVGDTVNVFIEVYFNFDIGNNVVHKHTMSIIIE